MSLVLPEVAVLEGVHAAIAIVAQTGASQRNGFRDGGITDFSWRVI
jgi:hypothetical protein